MIGESRITIRDNGRRHSMKMKDLVQENLSNGRGCIGMAESTKMTIFGEAMNHNQNHTVPSIFREPVNEIHRNICPYLGRYGQGLEQSQKGCCFTLIALAGITFNHHLLNFPRHARPKEVAPCPFICFEKTRVLR